MKLVLAESLRIRRVARRMTQVYLARDLGSSPSRVAKMEAGDGSVSLDLMARALLNLGVTRREVARILARDAA
jgi:transcriptional regulator with XRE-family HTH domain